MTDPECPTCGQAWPQPGTLTPIADQPGSHVAGAPTTSRAAALALIPKARSVRRHVLLAVANRRDGLMTDEMLERHLLMKHQTLSSARNWLVAGGWLEDSTERAWTSSGRKAVLWRLTEAGRAALREELNHAA